MSSWVSGAVRTASGSRRSAWITAVSALSSRISLLCATAISSTSAYTTREPGAACWATSCTFRPVGMPEPMSTNWRMPASVARNRTARPRKARLARAMPRMFGSIAIIARAAS